MHSMQRALLAMVLGCVPSLAAGQSSRPTDPGQFRDLVRTGFAAIAHGDTAALRSYLADDVRWVLGTSGRIATRTQLIAAISHLSPLVTIQYDVDSVSALRVGDAATVEYRLTDRRTFRAYQNVYVSRALDVFVRQDGTWRLLRHNQTWIVAPPATIMLDSAALSAFVGRYDRGAQYIDDVHFVGGQLVATSTAESLAGDVGAHLLPVSTSAFSPEGVAPMIVFERDATGRVTGYVQQQPNGTVARARRLDH